MANSAIPLSDGEDARRHATEMWRPVVGWANYYDVSDLGRVRSVPRVIARRGYGSLHVKGCILRSDPRDAYLEVCLSRDNRKTFRAVHLLVLEAFVGPRPEGLEGCHENGDSADNRLANLRWDTKGGNELDKVRHGTHNFARRTHCPRDHQLVAPNLVASLAKKGYRDCLACNRGRTTARNARVRRGIHLDWEAIADQKYAELMREVAA